MDLIERVERATGPDRELDAEIAAACRVGAEQWEWANKYPAWIGRPDGRVELEKGGPSFAAPHFTTSLDAAMTLVPSDPCIGWEVSDGAGGPTARIWHVGIDRADDWEVGASPLATPALALVAAALRARQETANER